MLIVCAGPDTYHARKKAQELVHAFRAKHDQAGFSTEVLQKPDMEAVLQRLSAPSLFAQKRMIRCDGLLSDVKIAEVRSLAKRLEQDADQTILVTVEDEPLSSKHEKEFEKIKSISYPHPLLSGLKFESAVKSRAVELGVNQELAMRIAHNTEGNMWLAEQELQKCSANPDAPLVETDVYGASVFDAAEHFIAARNGWCADIAALEDPGAVPSVFLTQARTHARVRDAETSGIHPFVAKKFSALRVSSHRAIVALLSSIKVFSGSRQGVSTTGEEDTLFE